MSHHHARGITTSGSSRKRKETASSGFYSSYKPLAPPAAYGAQTSSEPESPNWILAGYMAHEFLTNGTLFGQKFEPGRAKAVSLRGGSAFEHKLRKLEAESGSKMAHQGYADVANVLKTDRIHVPGVVNPAQLARWIRM